jgi:hypothetical protein
VILCSHRQAPWLPLCEHANTVLAGDLTDDDIGSRVGLSAEVFGVLLALRALDDYAVQVALEPVKGEVHVIPVPVGRAVQITGRAATVNPPARCRP